MIDLSTISTADLVAELSKRDGAIIDDADDGEILIIYHDVSLGKLVDTIAGPAKILVVRE